MWNKIVCDDEVRNLTQKINEMNIVHVLDKKNEHTMNLVNEHTVLCGENEVCTTMLYKNLGPF